MNNKPTLRLMTSWDDGCYNDRYVAEELKEHGIPAVFYIPNACVLSENEIAVLGRDFEVGGHTVSHMQDLKKLSYEKMFPEIWQNRHWLQNITGQAVNRFCYPRGRYNEIVIGVVKDCGFKQARTTLVKYVDMPDPYRQHTTIQVYNRKEYEGVHWMIKAKEFCALAAERSGVFHLWGHTDEIEDIGEWENLKRFFKWLKETYEIKNAYADSPDVLYMAQGRVE